MALSCPQSECSIACAAWPRAATQSGWGQTSGDRGKRILHDQSHAQYVRTIIDRFDKHDNFFSLILSVCHIPSDVSRICIDNWTLFPVQCVYRCKQRHLVLGSHDWGNAGRIGNEIGMGTRVREFAGASRLWQIWLLVEIQVFIIAIIREE